MAENFDLLGDPIPENFGGRGRPPHIPTQQNRNKVMVLLAMRWPDGRIARALSITPPTLRKHYFRELKARDEARDRLDGALFMRCWEQVEAGNVAAIKAFAKMVERNDMLLGLPMREPERQAKPLKLGKKEEAVLAAQSPDTTTPLGDLLARRMEKMN